MFIIRGLPLYEMFFKKGVWVHFFNIFSAIRLTQNFSITRSSVYSHQTDSSKARHTQPRKRKQIVGIPTKVGALSPPQANLPVYMAFSIKPSTSPLLKSNKASLSHIAILIQPNSVDWWNAIAARTRLAPFSNANLYDPKNLRVSRIFDGEQAQNTAVYTVEM